MSRSTAEVFKERFYSTAGITDKTLRTWLAQRGIGKGCAPTILKGGVPSGDTLVTLGDFLGKSVDWLLGRDEHTVAELGVLRESEPSEVPKDFIYIPRYRPFAQVTDRSGAFNFAIRRSWIEERFGHEFDSRYLRTFDIMHDVMSPTLAKGDTAIVHERDTTPQDGIFLVRIGGNAAVNRLQIQGRTTLNVLSDNPRYPSLSVDTSQEDFDILGRVVWFGRQI